MKLFLSSYRLGNNPQKLLELFSENKKIAIITNAMDFADNLIRAEKVRQSVIELTDLGLFPEEIDLRNYFGKPEELGKKLNDFGAVYVRGGNTFILKRAMRASGFDNWIKSKIKDPNFIYAGYSAGIAVLSPTLHGVDLVDDPNIIPAGYNSEIDWEGLNIVDYFPVPHYKSSHPEAVMVDKVVEYFAERKLPFKTLRDGEVIIKLL